MGVTHFQNFGGQLRVATSHPTGTEQKDGAVYFDSDDVALYTYYSGTWYGVLMTTSTSTSTSTTTTTSTSTSTTTTTTTSTSTSTSTTTT